MSRHVTTCHDMSRHHVTKEHHDVLRHVTKTVASFCSFCSMCARDEDLVRPLATWATESCKLRAVSGSVPAVRAPSKVKPTRSGRAADKASRRQGAKAPRIHEDCASSEKSATDWTKITHDQTKLHSVYRTCTKWGLPMRSAVSPRDQMWK